MKITKDTKLKVGDIVKDEKESHKVQDVRAEGALIDLSEFWNDGHSDEEKNERMTTALMTNTLEEMVREKWTVEREEPKPLKFEDMEKGQKYWVSSVRRNVSYIFDGSIDDRWFCNARLACATKEAAEAKRRELIGE